MKFSEMTDAELLAIRDAAVSAVYDGDTFSMRDLDNLHASRDELISRGYRIMWIKNKGVLIPPPPEAPGL